MIYAAFDAFRRCFFALMPLMISLSLFQRATGMNFTVIQVA